MNAPTPRPSRRAAVLKALRDAPHALRITDIARLLDVHANTVRFHLDALVDAGLVERVPSAASGPGRPALVYRPVPAMDPAGPRSFRFLSEVLLGELAAGDDGHGRAVDAGRRWALATMPASTRAPATATLVEMLDRLGFAPQTPSAGRIDLHNCPFLEVVEPYGRLVCALHSGLLRGAAERLGGRLSGARLVPFAEPYLCRIELPPGDAAH